MKKILCALLVLSLLFVGCSDEPEDNTNPNTPPTVSTDFVKNSTEIFSDKDYKTDYDSNTAVTVTLQGSTATAASDAVRITGGNIILTAEATYVITGTLDDGMLVVDMPADAKPHIILDGVSITSSTSSPIYVKEADKVFLTLASGTTNTLTNGGNFTAIDDNNIDAVIFSKQDLTLNGDGNLQIQSPAGHGIVSKDDLVITGGQINVTAASHALDANDSVRINNATITATASKDAIHAENADDTTKGYVYIENGTFSLTSQGDGVSASSSMQINNGSFNVTTSGTTSTDTDSFKGFKSSDSLLISGGTFTINSSDDAIHSNTSVIVNGGSFQIATKDDAFHADETLSVTGGAIEITESYEGLEALNVSVTGGDIKLVASDDGINAAGGNDSSGFGGMHGGDAFGGGMRPGRPGGPGGMGRTVETASSAGGSIHISGGSIYIRASGDGIDANGTISISGGYVVVCGPTSGDTAVLDYDTTASITGGTFIGTGAMQMAQTFSTSTQGVIAARGSGAANTKITLTDADGNILIDYTPALSFQLIILSTPDMQSGTSYRITVGTATADLEAS